MAQTLNRVNALLLALVLLLGALLWWPTSKPDDFVGRGLTSFSVEEIETITIQGRDDEPFTLARHGQRWWLTGLRQLPADRQKIEALLALAKAPVYDRFAPATTNNSGEFINSENNHWVRFNLLTIRFGQAHPVGQRRYLSLDNQIALIDDLYYHHVLSHPVDWVSRQPIPAGATLSRIALPELTLTSNDGRWQSAPAAASTDQLNQLVSGWQNLYAARVTALADDIEVNDLPQVALQWQDTPNTQESQILYLRTLDDERQLLNDEQRVVYHLNPTIADALFQIPAESP